MTRAIERNKKRITDLFSGEFSGHAIIMDPPQITPLEAGDYAISEEPVGKWLPWAVKNYESRVKWQEELDDDSVPYVNMVTDTAIFAAAFGCPIHEYGDSNACALPIIENAEDADRIKVPGMDTPIISRIFELAEMVRKEVGPDVPISVPDIQSPFSIAAQIWKKEDMFVALYENPDAVKRLVDKCTRFLKEFLLEYKKNFPNCIFVNCMCIWAPPEIGCSMSEDEAGSMSVPTLEEFCMPSLVELSECFGGMILHCCANADHQHGSFSKIPNLRGVNRVMKGYDENHFLFDPTPALLDFPENVVQMVGWFEPEVIDKLMDIARPGTRFLFEMPQQPLDGAKRTYEAMRKRFPRMY